ncbi:protein kinase domain protein [Ichthyophthirius multifiliis]|uniref:Aurora kinase n=1 Tax=Ichthyophthirius multifiliis TaxID=5932 RepID=G0QKU2_ICHMU|nr:protein kinase domain protein [Ichthyophthirius multifiliis]EGR34166.1 protein kinase domain protein [Ichthyophthirius multifiliis]|eukprot:XP_004039470.1 protein kinase domain protein [Ichthyophthirius multifiliis]
MTIIKKLGEGKFSEVYLSCDKKTSFLFALKKIKKETINQYNITQDIIKEIKSQTLLEHPNLIKLYGFFADEEAIYLIQELGHGKELFADLKSQPNKRFKEPITANFIRQIIQALIYMHQKKFIHRDIKLENIMLTNGVLKLCDFGYTTAFQEDQMRKTFCGTLDYASPEMVEGKEYDNSVDAWSIGILTYELIFGQAPFTDKNDMEKTFLNIVKNEIDFPGLISFEGVDFIKKLLVKKPQERMTLNDALQHPFIQSGMTSRQNQSELEFSDMQLLN